MIFNFKKSSRNLFLYTTLFSLLMVVLFVSSKDVQAVSDLKTTVSGPTLISRSTQLVAETIQSPVASENGILIQELISVLNKLIEQYKQLLASQSPQGSMSTTVPGTNNTAVATTQKLEAKILSVTTPSSGGQTSPQSAFILGTASNVAIATLSVRMTGEGMSNETKVIVNSGKWTGNISFPQGIKDGNYSIVVREDSGSGSVLDVRRVVLKSGITTVLPNIEPTRPTNTQVSPTPTTVTTASGVNIVDVNTSAGIITGTSPTSIKAKLLFVEMFGGPYKGVKVLSINGKWSTDEMSFHGSPNDEYKIVVRADSSTGEILTTKTVTVSDLVSRTISPISVGKAKGGISNMTVPEESGKGFISMTGTSSKLYTVSLELTGEGISKEIPLTTFSDTIPDQHWTAYVALDYIKAGTYTVTMRENSLTGKVLATRSFTVAQAAGEIIPSIKVLSPNGGESYKIGDSVTIKWEETGCNTVGIELWQDRDKDDEFESYIQLLSHWDVQPKNNSFTWKIPETYFTKSMAVPNNRIRMSCTGGSAKKDMSDGSFSIKTKQGGTLPLRELCTWITTEGKCELNTWTYSINIQPGYVSTGIPAQTISRTAENSTDTGVSYQVGKPMSITWNTTQYMDPVTRAMSWPDVYLNLHQDRNRDGIYETVSFITKIQALYPDGVNTREDYQWMVPATLDSKSITGYPTKISVSRVPSDVPVEDGSQYAETNGFFTIEKCTNVISASRYTCDL